MKEKFKKWLAFEKEDLDRKVRSYPRFRFLLLLTVFFGLAISLFWWWTKTSLPGVADFDYLVIDFFSQKRSPFLKGVFQAITFLGNEYFISFAFIGLAFLLVKKRRKRAAAAALFSLLGSAFFIFFLKNIFGRPRPTGCLANGDCLAFPSGHATMAFYFYGLLLYLIWRFFPVSLKTFLFLSLIISGLIALISFSRLVLQVHYPSDLVGGFFLGSSFLLLAVFLIDLLY